MLPYDNERRQSFSSSTNMSYHHHQHPDSSSPYSTSSGGFEQSEFDDDRAFAQRFAAASSPVPQFCACRTNPAMVHALIPLNHQLQNATTALRQYPHHNHDTQCLLFRRIAELHNLMQYVFDPFITSAVRS
jgi:hypothetical protein